MKELSKRMISGAVYAIVLIIAILASEYSFIALFTLFGLICLYELQKLLKLNSYASYFVLIGFILFFSVFKENTYALYALLIVTLLVKILLLKDLLVIHKIPLFEGKKYVVTIFYLISSIVFLTLIPYHNSAYHPEILIGVFLLIWVNDSFAYLVGKNLGKRKLFERISPNKTVEGFLGGLIFTLLASIAVEKITQSLTYEIWFVLAFLISVFGTFGDLIQSKLKRQADVKDSGAMMPGHGGLFDRLDSVLFAGTFVYAFLLIIR